MVLVALLPMTGFTFAIWDHGCILPWSQALPALVLLAALWAVPHMGTMWLNAALDRDEGPVLFGRAVPVPRGIENYGYATIALSVIVAFAAELGLGLSVLGCAALSILYSHPRSAWKGHAFLGPFANAFGYGVLSPLGGFCLAGLAPSMRGVAVLCVSVSFILAAYLAAQAFQEEEDRVRGYRTLVAIRGPHATLTWTRAFLWLAVLGTLGLATVGWFPRMVLASAPAFFFTDRLLVRWRDVPHGGDATWAARFFSRIALSGIICVIGVSIEFGWAQSRGLGIGGLATLAGHPSTPACASNLNFSFPR